MGLGKAGAEIVDAVSLTQQLVMRRVTWRRPCRRVGDGQDDVEVALTKTGGKKGKGEEASPRDGDTISENGEGV